MHLIQTHSAVSSYSTEAFGTAFLALSHTMLLTLFLKHWNRNIPPTSVLTSCSFLSSPSDCSRPQDEPGDGASLHLTWHSPPSSHFLNLTACLIFASISAPPPSSRKAAGTQLCLLEVSEWFGGSWLSHYCLFQNTTSSFCTSAPSFWVCVVPLKFYLFMFETALLKKAN